MVCGRCAQKTAARSTYCPRCRWTLLADAPEQLTSGTQALVEFDLPRGSGFLDKRRLDHHRGALKRARDHIIDERMHALEIQLAQLEKPVDEKPASATEQARTAAARAQNLETRDLEMAQLHREMGEIAFLDGQFQRAHAHLQRAFELNRGDLQTQVNFGVVLAQRGQLGPALETLRAACKARPDAPLPLLNLALVALEAHRGEAVLEVVAHLERLWQSDANFNTHWRDVALTARGLALLQLHRPAEARLALEAAARHLPTVSKEEIQQAAPESTSGESTLSAGAALPFENHALAADALNNLALAEIAMGDVAGGAARLRAALRLEPGHARGHNNLGVLAFLQGRLDIASKYFEVARQIEEQAEAPDSGRISNFAVLLAARGDIDGSFEQLVAAGGHERAEFEVFYNLGRAYIEHGKPDKGVENLRRAFAVNPQHPDVHAVLGAAYLLRGQSELLAEALKHFKRAIQIQPHHRIALSDLTLSLVDMGQDEAAARILTQTLKTFPHSVEGQYLAALLTMEEGSETQWAAAGGRFLSLSERRPDLVSCLYNAALCQFLMGFRDAASRQLEIVVARDATFGPAYYMMGIGHAQAKRMDEALAAWQKAVHYEPENAELQANMGFIYYKRAQYDRAIKCYTTAHQLVPDDPQLLSSLGLCFARAKMFKPAVTAFNQSLMIDSRAPSTHSNIGLAYYLQQKVEMAIEHWRIVSQLDRSYAERRGDEIQKSFDDTFVSLRPLNWRERVVGLAPTLPSAHTRLLPGYAADTFELMLSDPALQRLSDQKRQLELADRHLAGMNLHLK